MAPIRHFKKIAPEEISEALKWFERQQLSTQWYLSRDEQLALLGNIEPHLYQCWLAEIARGQIPALPNEVITRLEILLGAKKSLDIVAPDNRPDLAISWFNTPNNNPIFQGKSIKHYLLDNNNLDAFRSLEAYLVDAVVGLMSGVYI